MNRLTKAALIGAVAGIVDVAPMIAQGLNWYANASAFAEWIALGIVIPHIDIGLEGWLKGLVVAEMCVVPVMIIVAMNGLSAVVPIVLSTAFIGSLVGHFGDKYAAKTSNS